MIFILGFIAALLFVYWVYSEPSNRVDKVRIGMTQQDVRKLLGPPRASEGVTIKQNYRREALLFGKPQSIRGRDVFPIRIVFENDKVAEINIKSK